MALRPVVVQLVRLESGVASEADGQWLVEYDPSRAGVSPRGRPTLAHVLCSPDPAAAKVFDGSAAAFDYVRRPSTRHVRHDGRVWRPLLAYTLALYPVGEDGMPDRVVLW